MNTELPAIQIVGLKNSGKTTLVCELIALLTKEGYRSASLKHHGHGGTPTIADNTDSARHKQAGAMITAVEGGGELHLSITDQDWTLEKIFAFYKLIDIDCLIIEGYKHAEFPKVLLVRKKEDLYLLNELTNISAVIAAFELSTEHPFPIFQQKDLASFKKWFLSFINKKLQK